MSIYICVFYIYIYIWLYIYIYTSDYTVSVCYHPNGAFLVTQMVKNLPAMQETRIWSLGWEDSLEKGMATHFSTLVWWIPRTEEPGRLQSRGCKESDMTEQLTLLPYLYLSRVSNISIKLVTKQLKIISLSQYITKKDLPLHI